jgi:hypothetical protein
MNTEPTRKLTLLDMMVLTAATATGMALMRLCGRRFQMLPQAKDWHWHAAIILQGIWLSWYFLTAWGPALFVIRLLPPRPRLRKVLRQPGTVACYAMILPLSVQATTFIILTAKERNETAWARAEVAFERGFLMHPYFMGEQDAGLVVFSVVGAWLTLVLTGRWRPERNWIDRAGRFLGFAWIAGYVITRSWAVLTRLSQS